MRVITIKRTVVRRRSIQRLVHNFLSRENPVEFAIEAVLFGTLLALSAWPIVQAAGAISRLM